MAYYTVADARAAFYRTAGTAANLRTAETLLKSASHFTHGNHYDIFLSHSFQDAIQIQGVKALLEEQGWVVYVDWIDDSQLDRSRITKTTAERLKLRMRSSDSMIFATSPSSPTSKWMPWELGYFDGLRGERVAIMPLVDNSDREFNGQEYLSLYPTVEKLRSRSADVRSYVTKGVGSREYKRIDTFKRAGEFEPLDR
jgi:hypothetical protein